MQQRGVNNEASGHPDDENHDPGDEEPLVHDFPLIAIMCRTRSDEPS
jgi:hypothetical protein